MTLCWVDHLIFINFTHLDLLFLKETVTCSSAGSIHPRMIQLPHFQALSSVCTPKLEVWASGWQLICIHQGQVTEMVSWCLGYCSKSYVSFQPSTKRRRIVQCFRDQALEPDSGFGGKLCHFNKLYASLCMCSHHEPSALMGQVSRLEGELSPQSEV